MTSRTSYYTVAGGIKLFYKASTETGYRDLGNITAPSIESVINTITHYTSRSGTRAKDREAIIEKAMSLGFTFDEPNIDNLQLAFLGGSISDVVAAPTTSITNEGVLLFGTDPTGLAFPINTGAPAVVVKDWANAVTYLANTTVSAVSVTKTTKTIVVATDLTATFAAGRTFTITGAAVTGNNATYTVASSSYSAPNTSVVVVEEPSDDGADGTINVGDYTVSTSGNSITRTAYSTILTGAKVLVTYNWNAPAHKSFAALAGGILTGSARLVIFPTTGAQLYWDIPSIEIRPSGSITVDDQNWMAMPMTLSILDNSSSTPTAPFGTIRSWLKE